MEDQMTTQLSNQLSTLGHPQRLAVFRLLMRRYPDAVPATELANALEIKPNTLSNYVSALAEVGLISQTRAGTSLRYSIDMERVQTCMETLFHECLQSRASLGGNAALPIERRGERYKVLFICSRNSGRSIFAEAVLRHEAGDRFEVFSAGTTAGDGIDPRTLSQLESKGFPTAGLRSKSISEFQGDDAPRFDFVFTVCSQAANEDCAAWLGQPISAHWGVPDPLSAEGTEAERALAFQHAFGALRNRIRAFTELPIETLDRMSLQQAVDTLSHTNGETE